MACVAAHHGQAGAMRRAKQWICPQQHRHVQARVAHNSLPTMLA